MARRADAAWLAAALVLAAACGCSSPVQRQAEVGSLRVRFVLPPGWEHLDHGRQQLFRRGESQISLTDRGEANRDSSVVFAEAEREVLEACVLALVADPRRHEVASRASHAVGGTSWTVLERWDRVSHLSRSRAAYTVTGRSLLVLAIDRGPYEHATKAFEALLASLEPAPRDSTAR